MVSHRHVVICIMAFSSSFHAKQLSNLDIRIHFFIVLFGFYSRACACVHHPPSAQRSAALMTLHYCSIGWSSAIVLSWHPASATASHAIGCYGLRSIYIYIYKHECDSSFPGLKLMLQAFWPLLCSESVYGTTIPQTNHMTYKWILYRKS
jgi:hypothetical protein